MVQSVKDWKGDEPRATVSGCAVTDGDLVQPLVRARLVEVAAVFAALELGKQFRLFEANALENGGRCWCTLFRSPVGALLVEGRKR